MNSVKTELIWHKCSDKLPKKDGIYLVLLKNDKIVIADFYLKYLELFNSYTENKWCYFNGQKDCLIFPIAWASLPQTDYILKQFKKLEDPADITPREIENSELMTSCEEQNEF